MREVKAPSYLAAILHRAPGAAGSTTCYFFSPGHAALPLGCTWLSTLVVGGH